MLKRWLHWLLHLRAACCPACPIPASPTPRVHVHVFHIPVQCACTPLFCTAAVVALVLSYHLAQNRRAVIPCPPCCKIAPSRSFGQGRLTNRREREGKVRWGCKGISRHAAAAAPAAAAVAASLVAPLPALCTLACTRTPVGVGSRQSRSTNLRGCHSPTPPPPKAQLDCKAAGGRSLRRIQPRSFCLLHH